MKIKCKYCDSYNFTINNEGKEICYKCLKESNTMKDQIRDRIDSYFCDISRDLNLKNGDISPDQEIKLDTAIDTIVEVINQWIKQNK